MSRRTVAPPGDVMSSETSSVEVLQAEVLQAEVLQAALSRVGAGLLCFCDDHPVSVNKPERLSIGGEAVVSVSSSLGEIISVALF